MPIVTDCESVRIPNYYKASPADFEAVENIIAQVSEANSLVASTCMIIRNYLESLKHFRRIELAHARSGDPSHREVLESLRESGDRIWGYLEKNPDIDVSGSGYTKGALRANLDYLADRFDIWYGPRDEAKADAFLKLIHGEA